MPMSGVDIVVGGQTGSEAKGRTVVMLCKRNNYGLAIRSGARNAGHTTNINGHKYVTRQLPSAIQNPGIQLGIASAGMIHIGLLQQELNTLRDYGMDVSSRLWIDQFATIMEDDSDQREKDEKLNDRLGSTQTGVGITQAERVMRRARVAKDSPELQQFMSDVSLEANKIVDAGGNVIIESTQGFGLSLYHNRMYPFATSRDTSASAFLSDAGMSPRLVRDIWMVIRTYQIRVAGSSGPLSDEIDWDTVRRESGAPHDITEMTSVTRRIRRVSRIDWNLVRRAIMVNRPTHMVLACMDYVNYNDKGKTTYWSLSQKSKDWIKMMNDEIGMKPSLVYTGPEDESCIEL